MYFMYVLKSLKDRKLYWGSTDNLKRRFTQHQNGLCLSTRHRRPFIIVYYEAYRAKSDARKRERQMKLNGKAWAQLKRRISDSINEV